MKALKLILPLGILAVTATFAHAGKMFDTMDSNKDGKVTETEFLSRWEAVFRQKDKNKDGILQPDEWKPPSSAWDSSKDGLVDFDEFMTVRKRQLKTNDKDGDGLLTPDELPN